ncbi:MAG: molybdopterin-dependent oxidoreductase, partial [Streptomycetaceae bacterium]|nr:molybdopterin-dependent oxidoreductase [Streptomycetaceae bacterium]
PGPGVSAYVLLDSLGTESGPQALLVFGSNPVVSAPNAIHIEKRLRNLQLLVVCDFIKSETAELADVVLPTAQWAEEDGTMTNLEGRVLRRRALRRPPPGIGTDLAVLAELASRLDQSAEPRERHGHPGEGADRAIGDHPTGARFVADPRATFEELRRATAGGVADYAGVTWERVDAEDGVFWPCSSADRAGTPRLFEEAFFTADGRAVFHPVEHRPVAEDIDADFPLYLTTGRLLAQYQSGAQTRRIAPLRTVAGSAFVELHPDLAARLDISSDQRVRVTSRRGSMTAPARLTETIRPDTVFVPFHFAGEQRVNSLTGDALDPVSKMPEFKVCAVRIEPEPSGEPEDA